MTAPVTDLTIRIDDDGQAWLSAADWSREGHLWAIEKRPLTIQQVRAVAGILGADAVDGVEARLRGLLERQRLLAESAEAAVRRADAARHRVATLERLLEGKDG